jgi:hypothetical protein
VPRRTYLPRAFYRFNFPDTTPPAGYERLAQNRSYRVYVRPGCRA